MPGKKILLVDDTQTMLMIERTILSVGGYHLVTAKDGQEAVAKAATERPDLILMDVVMPKMSGFEACRQLRQMEATRAIPIFMVTARGEPENVEEGFASGCTDYITKPINGPDLLSKIRSILGT
jgi:CheY-like chemotaxis protein